MLKPYRLSTYIDAYLSHGLVILPIKRGEKGPPIFERWDELSREELLEKSNVIDWSRFNVGLRLDNLICLDIERPELYDALCVQPLEAMASKTWIQRTGKGYHVLFKGESKPFRIEGFVELRSGPQQYILIPPSIHPNGRSYEWITDIQSVDIADISQSDLERLRHKLKVLKRFQSFIDGMVDCWRRHHRHNLSLWVSGVLYKMGLSYEDAEFILKTIVSLNHDEEMNDRLKSLQTTYSKPYEKVRAWSGLREELASITSLEEAENIIKLLPIQKGLLFKVVSLRELVESAREISYISYPLLPMGCLVIFAGRGGVGKSLTALHIAYEVSNGGKIFGLYDCKQVRVLILDSENSPSIYKTRVEAMDLNPLDNIDVLNFSKFKLDVKGAMSRLSQLIKLNNYGLVVIDNWTTHVLKVDENNAVEVSNILSMLRRICYETNCTIILIHHLRKGLPYATHEVDELRGSSVLVNDSDIVWIMEVDKVLNHRILRIIKNRFSEDHPSIVIKWVYDAENRLKLMGLEEEITTVNTKIIDAVKCLVEFLKLKGGKASRKEVFNALTQFSDATKKRAIDYSLAIGLIERVERGCYQLVEKLEDFAK